MEKFIKQLVLGSGKILKREFKHLGVAGKAKSDALDVVTHADLLSEKYTISSIKEKFPTHQIISEESGDNKLKSDHVWVIDPLDGTLNFSRGIPAFVSQVAYLHKGVIKVSAIYDPMSDELYFAEKGKGAFLNGKRIRCSPHKDFKNSLPTLNCYYDLKTLKLLNKLSKASHNPHFRLRNTGAIGLGSVYTASGRFDYFISNSGNFWDYAPPYLILKEAGCEVKTISGKEWERGEVEFVAGNKTLVKDVLKALGR